MKILRLTTMFAAAFGCIVTTAQITTAHAADTYSPRPRATRIQPPPRIVETVIVDPAAPIVLSEAQLARVSYGFDRYITRMNIWSMGPWEFPATVGGVVPSWVNVYGVPAELAVLDPALSGREFIVVGDDVVVLEPVSRRIVAMVSRRTGAGLMARAELPPPVVVAPPAVVERRTVVAPTTTIVETTGAATPVEEYRIRLTRNQVMTIRSVLRDPACRYDRRSDFFVGDLVPAAAPLCDVPDRVVAVVPDMSGYRYITRGAAIVVDPDTDRVVSVIR